MIPEKTKQFLSVPKRHPWAFIAVYTPVVASVFVGSAIHQFTFQFCFPLLVGFFVSVFLIQGVAEGQLSDSGGTVSRLHTPVRFWVKFIIWSAVYVFAIAWFIGFSMQEQRKATTELDAAANRSQPIRADTNPMSATSGSNHCLFIILNSRRLSETGHPLCLTGTYTLPPLANLTH